MKGRHIRAALKRRAVERAENADTSPRALPPDPLLSRKTVALVLLVTLAVALVAAFVPSR